jgi:hypothetical protein
VAVEVQVQQVLQVLALLVPQVAMVYQIQLLVEQQCFTQVVAAEEQAQVVLAVLAVAVQVMVAQVLQELQIQAVVEVVLTPQLQALVVQVT